MRKPRALTRMMHADLYGFWLANGSRECAYDRTRSGLIKRGYVKRGVSCHLLDTLGWAYVSGFCEATRRLKE